MTKPAPTLDWGPLRFNSASERWEITGSLTGTLHEIGSGDLIFIDVAGEMTLTRIEHSRSEGGYYSVDGYRLRDGIEAALANR